ncbi:unnamed protein product [Ceratitis capitata]|uniref:(Mediterranean fruit fly) hypothetical protein n=1 Tax=Ceratitis capitata TaxID=7213 RepID=A0A811ULP7_CERCA|nr:unnamed protein product [Ceratitis capitata]
MGCKQSRQRQRLDRGRHHRARHDGSREVSSARQYAAGESCGCCNPDCELMHPQQQYVSREHRRSTRSERERERDKDRDTDRESVSHSQRQNQGVARSQREQQHEYDAPPLCRSHTNVCLSPSKCHLIATRVVICKKSNKQR